MAHTASTAVSRYFEKTRGKALSYIWLGMSLGEFLLPVSKNFIFILPNLAITASISARLGAEQPPAALTKFEFNDNLKNRSASSTTLNLLSKK